MQPALTGHDVHREILPIKLILHFVSVAMWANLSIRLYFISRPFLSLSLSLFLPHSSFIFPCSSPSYHFIFILFSLFFSFFFSILHLIIFPSRFLFLFLFLSFFFVVDLFAKRTDFDHPPLACSSHNWFSILCALGRRNCVPSQSGSAP